MRSSILFRADIKVELLSVIAKVDKPEYYPVLEGLSFSSDLQRLNSFWIESSFNDPGVDKEGKLIIRRFLSDVDNIINTHSKAVYEHTTLLINKINAYKLDIEGYYICIHIFFSLALITALVLVAFRFASKISTPIMNALFSKCMDLLHVQER